MEGQTFPNSSQPIDDYQVKKAKKEAKRIIKQGYLKFPGTRPIENQIIDSWSARLQKDEFGKDKYIVYSTSALGPTRDEAKNEAVDGAKFAIAESIGFEVTAVIKSQIEIVELSNQDAATVTNLVATAQSEIYQILGEPLMLAEYYRKAEDSVEVFITIAYSLHSVMEFSKNPIRKKMEEETSLEHDRIDMILNY
jgi:hypothetical protein